MEQKSNVAAVKDVQIKPSKEECASGTEQRGNYAAVMDAQNKLGMEECV